MTFRSLTVEAPSDRESAHAPFALGMEGTLIASLNTYTFPKSAVVYAKEHGLHIDYIDNCWACVAIDGLTLKGFLAFGRDTELDLELLTDKIDEAGWYVVTEEEF